MKQPTRLISFSPHSDTEGIAPNRKGWKWIVLLVSVLICLGIAVVVQMHEGDARPPDSYLVSIGGQIADFYAVRNPDILPGIALPFTAMLEALGTEVVWQDETTANITLPNDPSILEPGLELVLDLEEMTLCRPGDNDNLLYPVWFGSVYELYSKRVGRELYVDVRTVNLFIRGFFSYRIESIDEEAQVMWINMSPDAGTSW